MICAVDTNVILDVLADDPEFGERSERLLADALDSGSLVICELVYAELAPQFETHEALDSALAAMGARVVEGGIEVAWDAGRRMADYRSAGGSKQRLLADFYIGAHAAHRAEALLTRDRGFYGAYFPELKLIGGG